MENDPTVLDKRVDAKAIQKAELEKAKRAAIAGESSEFVTALFNSLLPDGLSWRLRSQLPEDDVDAVIAEALKTTYDAISTRGEQIDLASYLSKVCYNLARARYATRKNVASVESSDLEQLSAPLAQRQFQIPQDELVEIERKAALRRQKAINLARGLLPRIGEDNIQRVMSVILDSVERQLVEVSYAEIAEIVGLSEGTVQKLVSRGFERLEREARRDGLWLDVSDVFTIEQEKPF